MYSCICMKNTFFYTFAMHLSSIAGHFSRSQPRGVQGPRLCTARKFGPRSDAVTRALGVRSRGVLALFAGLLSAEPEPSRMLETHANKMNLSAGFRVFCAVYNSSRLAWSPGHLTPRSARSRVLPRTYRRSASRSTAVTLRPRFFVPHGVFVGACVPSMTKGNVSQKAVQLVSLREFLLWVRLLKVALFDLRTFMFGLLAATSSHIAYNLGITASSTSSSPEHLF